MPGIPVTTNFPGGETNAPTGSTLQNYIKNDPTIVHENMVDFGLVQIGANLQWLSTPVGTPTYAAANVDGGALLITTSTGATDAGFLQWLGGNASTVAETFGLQAGKRSWVKTKFKLSDSTNSAFAIGQQITNTTPLNPTDGVYFIKATGAQTVSFVVKASSVATTITNIATMVDNTFITLGYEYNGVDRFNYYVNDVLVGGAPVTNMPAHTLALTLGLQNGAAAAKTATVDYIFGAEER